MTVTPRSIWRGIRNVIRWAPVVWHDADYDWAPLARIMEYKLRRMSAHHEGHRNIEDWYVVATETLRAADCLHEMLTEERADAPYMAALYTEEYGEVWDELGDEERKNIFRFAHGVTNRTSYRFGNLMANIQNWWD